MEDGASRCLRVPPPPASCAWCALSGRRHQRARCKLNLKGWMRVLLSAPAEAMNAEDKRKEGGELGGGWRSGGRGCTARYRGVFAADSSAGQESRCAARCRAAALAWCCASVWLSGNCLSSSSRVSSLAQNLKQRERGKRDSVGVGEETNYNKRGWGGGVRFPNVIHAQGEGEEEEGPCNSLSVLCKLLCSVHDERGSGRRGGEREECWKSWTGTGEGCEKTMSASKG